MKHRILIWLLPLLCGILAIALWYGIRASLDADHRFLLPAPDEVLAALSEHREILGRATLNTAQGAILGFALAVSGSVLCALVLSLSAWMRAALYPYLMMLQMTPIIIVAPILVLWVGAGLKSVAIITFLVSFFPLVVNTTQGLISTDRHLVELFQLYRLRRWQEIFWLRIPAALPYFFTGLRIAATLAPIGAIVGDYTAGSSAGDGGGLGFQVIVWSAQAKYPAVFATAAIACALGFVFVAGVHVLSWLALHRWHDAYRTSER